MSRGQTNIWQGANGVVVGGNNNTAGTDAVVAGGDHNSAGVNGFVAGGANNVSAGGWGAVIGGKFGSTGDRYGGVALGGGSFDSATPGQAQVYRQILRATSPDTTPIRVTWNAETASQNTTCVLLDNSAALLNLYLIGKQGNTDQVVLTCLGALIVRGASAAATVIVGSPTFSVIASTAGAAGTTATLTADTSIGSPNITVTPPTSADWTWVCLYEAVEII